MNNIDKDLLSKILNEKGMMLTVKEIEDMMDAEVAKPEEEMDTELIDLCASVLAEIYHPEIKDEVEIPMFCPWEEETKPQEQKSTQQKKKRSIPFKTVLLVAAIAILVFVVALPAGAKLFNNKASDGIIEFYEDFFKINLSKDEPTTADENDLVNQMILESLDSLILPEVLLSDEYEKEIHTDQNEFMTTIWISVNNSEQDISGLITVTQFKSTDHNMTNGYGNIPDDTYKYFKELLISGKKVIVFGNGEKSYINYSDVATNYEIALTCDFNTMVSIAETIKNKG